MSKVAFLSFHNDSVVTLNYGVVDNFDELHNDAIKVLIFFSIIVLEVLMFDFLKTYVDQLLELSVFGEHWNYAGHVNFFRIQ